MNAQAFGYISPRIVGYLLIALVGGFVGAVIQYKYFREPCTELRLKMDQNGKVEPACLARPTWIGRGVIKEP